MAKKNSGANGVKNTTTKKSVEVSFAADVMTKESVQLNAVTAAAVAGASSHAVSVAVGAGLASAASVPAGRASAVAGMMDQDIALRDFKAKVCANWAAPEWSGAAALRDLLSASGLSADQISAAVAAAGRKSGEDLTAGTPSLQEIIDLINDKYSKEFRALCGCACPASADLVRSYSLTNLSLNTIAADSDINDYLISRNVVTTDLSTSAKLDILLSVRNMVEVKRAFAAARAGARNDFKDSMRLAARKALRLGLSASVAARYFSLLLNAVPAADNREEKRLRKNLASCWAAVRKVENNIVLAAGAGAFGAIEDQQGGWCFPASLPASAPAKVRKLWAKRVRLLSDINTLDMLLGRC